MKHINKILGGLAIVSLAVSANAQETNPMTLLSTTVNGYSATIGTFAAGCATIAAGYALVRVLLKYLRRA